MSQTIILCDTSSSMDEMSGTRRRIDVLRDVLQAEMSQHESPPLLFEFNSIVRQLVGPGQLTEPSGGTALAAALAYIALFHPNRLIVISDGEPTDGEEQALENARKLKCDIATYFVGSDDHFAATAFMRHLAWCSTDGFGVARVCDLQHPERLAGELHQLLAYDYGHGDAVSEE